MPTFDGENLHIILDTAISGTVSLNVQDDLYEPWKNWARQRGNMGYPFAFRTIGGDALTPGIKAGAYFFLNNEAGWRIKFPEADLEVLLAGNLAPEDSSIEVISPSDGNFKNVILGLQPITQNVEEILTLSQDAEYGGEVYIDTFSGTPGTDYPIGTPAEPVSNLADAMTIATRLGIRALRLIGVIQLTQTMMFWTITGVGAVAEVDVNSQDTSGTEFRGCGVYGTFPTLSQKVVIQQGRVSAAGLNNFFGAIANCVIDGNVSFQPGLTTIANCASNVAGTARPLFNLQGGNVDLSVRGWLGGLEIANLSNPLADVSIDVYSGAVRALSSCTAGNLVIRGVIDFDDQSNGTVVTQDGLLQIKTTAFGGSVHINTASTNTGTMFPNGTARFPVNNITDALDIATANGLSDIHFHGNITLDRDVSGLDFIGQDGASIVNFNGQNASGARFARCTVTGAMANTTARTILQDCFISTLTNVWTVAENCLFVGNVALSVGQESEFFHCGSSLKDGTEIVFDFASGLNTRAAIVDFAGDMEIQNMGHATNSANVILTGGELVVGATNTDGVIFLGGLGELEDTLNAGTVIHSNHQLDTPTVRDFGYNGEIYINTDEGVAGTDYPLGLRSNPVNNFNDAWTIAERVGVRSFYVVGEISITKTFRFGYLRGHIGSTKINVNNQNVAGTLFEKVSIFGTLPALTHGVTLRDCNINSTGLTGFKGEMLNTTLESNVSLAAGLTLFKNCASHVPGNTRPTIDCLGNAVNISVRGWHGGLAIANYSNALSTASFDFDAGALRLLNTVSAGEIVLRGVMDLDDQSVGGTIVRTGIVETNRLKIAHMIMSGRAVVSPDDLTVTVYDEDNITVLETYSVSADGRIRTPT